MNLNMKFMAKETWEKEQNSSEEEFMKNSLEFVGFNPEKKMLS